MLSSERRSERFVFVYFGPPAELFKKNPGVVWIDETPTAWRWQQSVTSLKNASWTNFEVVKSISYHSV